MENLELSYFKNKRVLVTGSTGFKGSWLCLWLNILGAKVFGISLVPNEENENFIKLNLENKINQKYINITDYKLLSTEIQVIDPNIIFHMAAQPIVIEAYKNPLENYRTNVMGTLNLFESIKDLKSLQAVINITSDKCYRNFETKKGYVESDKLGGLDPYSCSKSCAELVSQSYIYNLYKDKNFGIANVRAGNVVGGGDLCNYRLFTDIIQSIRENKELNIRNKHSTRPWQYVLDPIYGYLLLALKLIENKEEFNGEWNFGPSKKNNVSVGTIITEIKKYYPELQINFTEKEFEESRLLNLSSEKSYSKLGWYAKINIEELIKITLEDYSDHEDITIQRINRIKNYMKKWN